MLSMRFASSSTSRGGQTSSRQLASMPQLCHLVFAA